MKLMATTCWKVCFASSATLGLPCIVKSTQKRISSENSKILLLQE